MQAARNRWGWCGAQAMDGGDVAGVLLLTPTADGDALVKTLWVARPGEGLGKRLVQSAIAGLTCRDVRDIVSPAAVGNPTCQLPPRAFLKRVGFTHLSGDPLYRLQLDSVITEKASARQLMERLMASFGNVPEAATRVEG